MFKGGVFMKFILKQDRAELVLMTFFTSLLLYMLVVFFLKNKNKRTMRIYLLKNKDVFCTITYAIFLIHAAVGCLVSRIVDNIVVYFGTMLAATVIVNNLFILGYGLKRIKDIEFQEVSDTYRTLIDYTEACDMIASVMAKFIEEIKNEEEFIFNDFYEFWIYKIEKYLDMRIRFFEYFEVNHELNHIDLISCYVKEKVKNYNLWHDNKAIKKMAEDLFLQKGVTLASNVRIIPLKSDAYIFIEGKGNLTDHDYLFLRNTFSVLWIAAKEDKEKWLENKTGQK